MNHITEKTVSFIFESSSEDHNKRRIYPVAGINYKSRNDQLFSIFLTDGNLYTTVDNEIILNQQPSNPGHHKKSPNEESPNQKCPKLKNRA